MDLSFILDDCLSRMAAGESLASCLARYPENAQDLAPMLRAAQELRVLSGAQLSQGSRLRAKVALREAWAAQHARRSGWLWAPLRGLATVGLTALVLFTVVAVSAMAASQPGDMAYPAKIVVERAPAWLQVTDSGRIATELAFAERRFAEMDRRGQVDLVALNAMLDADEATVHALYRLSPEYRNRVAARVLSRAQWVSKWAATVEDPSRAEAIRAAVVRASMIVSRLQPDPTDPAIVVVATSTPTWTPGSPASATPQPTRTREPSPVAAGWDLEPERGRVVPRVGTSAPSATGPEPLATPQPRPSATFTAEIPGASPTPGPDPRRGWTQVPPPTDVRAPTWTPIPWPTDVRWPTWTPIPWPTLTEVPTRTPVPWPTVPTPSATPWPARTAIPWPTVPVPTATASPTRTAAPLPSATASPTWTSAPRPSPTATVWPTRTPVPQPTVPVPTATASPTRTSVPWPTAPATPTATRTAIPWPTITVTVDYTPRPTRTPFPTPSITPRGPIATALALTVTPTPPKN